MPFRIPALRLPVPLAKIRADRFRRIRPPAFPVLTAAEKTGLAALILLLAAGALLRAWERSGVTMGPVEDWETLRRLVIRARADHDREGGAGGFACAEDAPAGRYGSDAGEGERPLLAAGAGAMKPREQGGSKKAGPARPVDVNQAGERALLSLPGIGPSTARAILAHRAARGKFGSVEELLQVKGIGPKKLEAMRPFLRVIAPRETEKEGEVPPDPDSQAGAARSPPKIP